MVAACGFEWARLCRLGKAAAWIYALAVAAAFFAAYLAGQAARQPLFLLAAGFWILAVPAWLWRGLSPAHAGMLRFAGFVALVPAALALASLPAGLVLLMLILVWLADTAAYFVGIRYGRRKLAPSISPAKTWEGALGGVAAALGYAIICGIAIEGVRWVPYLAGAALLAVVSIVGDLFESAVKRQAEVKDSGTFLPGHGGILDRVDSATSALPFAALLGPWILGR